MNKILVALFLLALFPLVSAIPVNEATVVGGTIYENVITNGAVGAKVVISCNGVNQTTLSSVGGAYSSSFSNTDCECGDSVFVYATKGSLSGSAAGSITMCDLQPIPSITLDVGIVNVPLVPEFGLIAGLIAVLGAVGAFFVIRKK